MRASTNFLTIFGRGWSIVYELNISPQRKAYLKSLKKNRIIVYVSAVIVIAMLVVVNIVDKYIF